MTSAGSFPSYLLAARTASWLDDKQTALGTNEGTWIQVLILPSYNAGQVINLKSLCFPIYYFFKKVGTEWEGDHEV